MEIQKEFKSRNDLNDHIRSFQTSSMTKFVVYGTHQHFSSDSWQPTSKDRVFWEWDKGDDTPAIQFTGVPFIFIGTKEMGCHQGKDSSKSKKHRASANGSEANLAENKTRAKKEASARLRRALDRDPVVWENQFVVRTPCVSAHVGHPVHGEVASVREPVDSRVVNYITDQAKAGVRKCNEMRWHVSNFVKSELLQGESSPPLSRRRFCLSDKDLQNIMTKAREQIHHSNIDQVNLQILFQKWKEQAAHDKFHLRVQTETENFLLCYQTEWQQRLLHLYGQDICLLDATYRTIRYSLPLFFLCVETNVCYVVVGVMVVQEETTNAVKEGLQIFKTWNEDWRPAHFLVDYSLVEIQAVEAVFEGSLAILCDCHREKAWAEWVRKQDHRINSKEEVLSKMRAIAKAETQAEYEMAVKSLMDSSCWRENRLFRNWFSEIWLAEAKRWVTVFKAETLNIHLAITTNNGLERQNESFKHRHLENYIDSSLSEMMHVVVKDYIPQMQKRYTELNVRSSSGFRKFHAAVPICLHDKPRDMVKHVVSRMESSLSGKDVMQIDDGEFVVKSETEKGRSYKLHFGMEDRMPACECDDWKHYRLPCKHFCTVFQFVPGWTWQQLCPRYRNQPLFSLDSICLSETSSPVTATENTDESAVVSEETTASPDPETMPVELPPCRRSRKTTLRNKCVGQLKLLIDKVNLLTEETHLKYVSGKLCTLLEDVDSLIPKEAGIPIYDNSKMRKVNINPKPLQGRTCGRPKGRFSHRVGAHAELMPSTYRVRLKLPTSTTTLPPTDVSSPTLHHQPAPIQHQPASAHHPPVTAHHQPVAAHHQPVSARHSPASAHPPPP